MYVPAPPPEAKYTVRKFPGNGVVVPKYAESIIPIVTLIRFEQPLNAELPMLVTLSGIVILVKLLQPLNTETSILVTLSGIVILVKLLQL